MKIQDTKPIRFPEPTVDKPGDSTLNKVVIRADDLPTIPSIAWQILQVTNDERSSANDLSKILHTDQSLASRVLKVANSPFYGIPGRVTSIHQAVTLLGFRAIRSIALAMSVFNAFHVASRGAYFNRFKFWEHALFCGVAARELGKLYRLDENECFVAGLIHDVGKVVIDRYLPESFAKIINRVDEERCSMGKAEMAELGSTHASIGMKLLMKWKLPEKTIWAVGKHHAPWTMDKFQSIACLTYLANVLSKISGYPCYVSERVPTLEEFLESRGADYLRSNGFKIDEASLCKLEEKLLVQFNRAAELTQILAA